MTATIEMYTGLEYGEKVQEFDEGFRWPGRNCSITFDGAQFQEWIYQTLPVCRELDAMSRRRACDHGHKLEGGFMFYMLPLEMWHTPRSFDFWGIPDMRPKPPKRQSLLLHRGEQEASCQFSTEINIPVLGKSSRGLVDPWMSLTPNEVMTQRAQIKRAKKNTGMAGLGMGWAARKVLERKQVTHLTVYETSQGVIDYFGASLLEDFPGRVTLVRKCAYEVDWMAYDVSLWDIWEDYGGAAWDREFQAIKATVEQEGRVCVGWGKKTR